MSAPMPDLTAALPSALRAASRLVRLGEHETPTLLAHPDWESGERVPLVLWMHGRTVTKEIDPGRYLRWIRAGIGACAVDLPGHGERFDAALQSPDRTLDVVLGMAEEIDGVVAAALEAGPFDPDRIAIGGMSAGGMATLTRLTRPHRFRCCSVEATTGSWRHQSDRAMFAGREDAEVAAHDPVRHLRTWREIPIQAIHSRIDEWVRYEGQAAFIKELRLHYRRPEWVDFVTYERTGAPFEHAGFGVMAADAKNRQRDFLVRHLGVEA